MSSIAHMFRLVLSDVYVMKICMLEQDPEANLWQWLSYNRQILREKS